MFFLKKLLSRLLFPVPLCAELLVIGLILLLFTKRQKLAKVFLVAGTILLLSFSFSLFPNNTLGPLERSYPVLLNLQPPPANSPVFIGVLGQGISSDTNLSANLKFNAMMLGRMVEAARLHRMLPGSKILVSVAGASASEEEKRRALGAFYAILGIAPQHLHLVSTARDSEDEINAFKTLAGTNQVYLVSNGFHLPRAMRLARRHDLRAIPSPCSFEISDQNEPFSPDQLFPGAGNLANSERAIYEYLGLAFEKLKGVPTTNGPQ